MKIRCMGCMEEYESSYNVCPFCGTERRISDTDNTSVNSIYLKPGTILNRRYQAGLPLNKKEAEITYIGRDTMSQSHSRVLIREFFPESCCSRLGSDNTVDVRDSELFYQGLKIFLKNGEDLRASSVSGMVRIFHVFEENHTGYIIMEDLGEVSLKTYLDQKGKVGIEESLATLYPVMDTLNQLHGKGIIHRNVSPENIMLLPGGEVVLTGMNPDYSGIIDTGGKHSVTETDDYLAPEVLGRDRKITGACDIYSVCAILYRMLTGRIPENGLSRIKKDRMSSPLRFHAKITETQDTIIMNGLNPNPGCRTRSMYEMMQEFAFIRPVSRIENIPFHINHPAEDTRLNHSGHKSKERGSGWSKIAVIPAVLLLIALAAGAAFGLSHRSTVKGTLTKDEKNAAEDTGLKKNYIVPNLISASYEEAEELAGKENQTLERVDGILADGRENGTIVSQDPAAGEKSNASNTIKVVVTSKAVTLKKTIEDFENYSSLKGRKLSEKTEKKLKKNFNLEIKEEESNYIPGYMLRAEAYTDYDNDPGLVKKVGLSESIPQYSRLVMVVSKGREDIEKGKKIKDLALDEFQGRSPLKACEIAEEYDLYIGYGDTKGSKYTKASEAENGQVAALKRKNEDAEKYQEMKSGDTFLSGDRILMVLSKGPKGVFKSESDLEKYEGMDYYTAKSQLAQKDIELTRSSSRYSSSVPEGSIISISGSCSHSSRHFGEDNEYRNWSLHWEDSASAVVSLGVYTPPAPSNDDSDGGSSGGGSRRRNNKRNNNNNSNKNNNNSKNNNSNNSQKDNGPSDNDLY